MDDIFNHLTHISVNAGKLILSEYENQAEADIKSDNSPLTVADEKSHDHIFQKLKELYPDVPVLSEEGADTDYNIRSGWDFFWCVDPMDGTKEFLKRTGQFTVNIALIHKNEPIAGIIYAPVLDLAYMAFKGNGAFKVEKLSLRNEPQKAKIKARTRPKGTMSVVASKDHAGPAVKKMLGKMTSYDLKSMGSSLKFCLVAEGAADIYFRDVPTYEWDTAAAQIILEEAGGHLCTLDGNRLLYNKESLLNPAIFAYGADKSFWMNLISPEN